MNITKNGYLGSYIKVQLKVHLQQISSHYFIRRLSVIALCYMYASPILQFCFLCSIVKRTCGGGTGDLRWNLLANNLRHWTVAF